MILINHITKIQTVIIITKSIVPITHPIGNPFLNPFINDFINPLEHFVLLSNLLESCVVILVYIYIDLKKIRCLI